MRLYSLYVAALSTDATYDNIGVANWSCIELNTGIVCACLPTIKPLLAKFFPGLLSTVRTRKTDYVQHGTGVDVHPATFTRGSRHMPATVADNDSERVITGPDHFELSDYEGK
jgi:rhodopsin domain-containing protein